jgi:hypothetical protein
MSWFSQTKSKKDQMVEQRRRRRGEGSLPATQWFNAWQVLAVVLFLAISGLVTAICFVGLTPTVRQFVVGDRARVTITAQFPFSYVSALQTARQQKNAIDLVGPSFNQDLTGETRLRQAVSTLESSIDAYVTSTRSLTPDAHSADQQNAAREKLARDFSTQQGLSLDPRDVLALTQNTTSAQRTQAFDEGLMALHGILAQGIFDPGQQGLQSQPAQGELFNLDIPGRLTSAPVLSQEEALRELRINPAPVGVDPAAQAAIFHVLKQAVVPNIAYNADRTNHEKQAAAAAVKPQNIQVREGEVLIDPSSPVTPDQREALTAYQDALKLHGQNGLGWANGLVQRFLFVTLLLAAAVIFIKSGLGQLDQSPKLYALTALLLLVNLGLLRLVLALGDTSLLAQRPILQAVLPWMAPTMFAPLLIAAMIGAAPATLAALLISILFSLMTGDTLEVFLVNFLASLVAIHFCREVRVRARLVRAGLLGGLAAAVCAAYLGFLSEGDSHGIGQQMLTAALTGLLTAVVAIGVLPVLENLFKITTDITLLELTDFNHPLLRKLQLAAPGSYHHSLMVANLAERAASEIGANALLCRTCSLYHDIGKMVKPEYFTENQRDGFNPHEEVNPSMSALIIKSHVKEGLDLARQYKLPQVIQDVIAQHHGTTLIKYFYHKATRLQRQFTTPVPFPRHRHGRAKDTPPNLPVNPPSPTVFDDSVLDESFYRYDGPKPRFKESAVIALADCVEAASRSLRKVAPQAIEELVESLFNDRIEDHQLDDSPITLQELKKIKQSFNLTLLNMLHSRVQYPAAGDAGGPDNPAETPAPALPSAALAKESATAPKPPGKSIAVASGRAASSPA